jgi:hypothetical protein
MGLATVTSILFVQIVFPPLCVFDFLIQMRQCGYVTARNRPSWNVCLPPLNRFHVFVGRESMPPAEVFTLGTIHDTMIGFPSKAKACRLVALSPQHMCEVASGIVFSTATTMTSMAVI